MKKYNFIKTNGELIEMDSLSELGIKNLNWERLNHLGTKWNLTKSEADFLKKYNLSPSVWNVAVLQHFDIVYLFKADYLKIKVMKGGIVEDGNGFN